MFFEEGFRNINKTVVFSVIFWMPAALKITQKINVSAVLAL
jgi:hypothetical protein